MKKISVTGATAGFGKAISEKLISEGHIVIGCGRRTERLETMRNELVIPTFIHSSLIFNQKKPLLKPLIAYRLN
ncbi:hypothetical protein OURE66S_02775 [Oligella ureolytica]